MKKKHAKRNADSIELEFHQWLSERIELLDAEEALEACENVSAHCDAVIDGLRDDIRNREDE